MLPLLGPLDPGRLQAELGASAVDAQWIVESYALFLAALILVGGSLGNHYGRRPIYSLGIALFAAASVFCGLAQSPDQLIAARAIQGIGGAMLVAGSLAIISASFAGSYRLSPPSSLSLSQTSYFCPFGMIAPRRWAPCWFNNSLLASSDAPSSRTAPSRSAYLRFASSRLAP